MKAVFAGIALALLLPQSDAETRVIDYLRANVKPGQPVVVSNLINDVFKAPEERQVLDRLFNTFFKIPMTIVEFQAQTGRIPTLEELSEQFAFNVPGEMDVILGIMEADPRIPRFLTRDPRTGEILKIDDDAIRADPNFGRGLERTIGGWEGRTAPPFAIPAFQGLPIHWSALAGKPYMIYFWFTNCPPCVQTTPMLAKLREKYAAQGFEIVAVNADRILDLPYDDSVRSNYLRDQGARFLAGHLTPAMQRNYGGVTLFPTMFFVNRNGTIVNQAVSLQTEAAIEAAITKALR